MQLHRGKCLDFWPYLSFIFSTNVLTLQLNFPCQGKHTKKIIMGFSIQITSGQSTASVFQKLKKRVSMPSLFSEKKKSIKSEEDLCHKIRRYHSESSLASRKITCYNSSSSLTSDSNSCRLSAAQQEIESFERDFIAKLQISERTDENNNGKKSPQTHVFE